MKPVTTHTNKPSFTIPAMRKRIGPRRGLAMLLVIVALAVVTVSTTAFMNARLNSPEVSENVARAIKARVAAETGVDLATKIIASGAVDWRTAHVNGVLLDNFDYGGGIITVKIADINGNPPDANTTDIVVSAEGLDEGMIQVAEADVEAPPANATVDVDLSEFAAFATTKLTVDSAIIKSWKLSPNDSLGKPVQIGTNNLLSGAIVTMNGARISAGRYYVRSGASALTLTDTSGSSYPPVRTVLSESDAIPIPASPTPNTTGLLVAGTYNPIISFGTITVSQSMEFGAVKIVDTAEIIIDTPGTTLLATGNLNLSNGGDVLVQADADIVVYGNLSIGHLSTIEVQNGASVRLFVGGNLTIDQGVLGMTDTLVFDDKRKPEDGITFYQDPARVKVYKLNGSAPANWIIRGKSYACALFYGLNSKIDLMGTSAVFGNMVANEIVLHDNSRLFYDPVLNCGMGYTNPDSFVFNGSGSYDTNITTSATDLDDSTITSIKNYVMTTSSLDAKHSNWKKMQKKLRKFGMKLKRDKDDDDDG